jgi:hypothetical protein
MKQFFRVAACALALVMVDQAAADEPPFGYDHVQLSYHHFDIDGLDHDVDGFGLSGSLLLTDNIFLVLNWWDVSGSGSIEDNIFGIERMRSDFSHLDLRAGYRHPIADKLEITVTGGFARGSGEVRISFDDGNSERVRDSDDGFVLGLGLRYLLREDLELGVTLDHFDIDAGDTVFGINGIWNVTPAFSVGLGWATEGDYDQLSLFGRLYF